LFGDVGVGKLQASLNLVTINIPVTGSGNNYLTQGGGVGLKNTPLFGVPLGVGVDRQSFNGSLSWDSSSWSGTSDGYSASASDGISFEVGLGLGINVSHLENLLNLVVSCAY
jgi:hypothetical protein